MPTIRPKISFILKAIFVVAFFLGSTPANALVQPLQLNQAEVRMSVGDRVNVSAQNGAGLTVSSNSKAVKASMALPRQVTLIGVKVGKAKITVCSQDVYCAWVMVVVSKKIKANPPAAPAKKSPAIPKTLTKGTEGTKTSVAKPKVLGLSQTSATVQKQQTVDISASGSDGVLTAVSDSEVVRTAVNGKRITLYGIEPGAAAVTVCDSGLRCAPIRVLVIPNAAKGFTVNEKSITLYAGDTYWFSTSNGSNLGISASNSRLLTASVKNNLIFITTKLYYTGSTILKVCSGLAQTDCALVFVTVNKKPTPPTAHGSFKSVTVEEGQSTDVPFPSNFVLSYRVVGGPGDPANTPNASITINNNSFTIHGKSYGTATFQLCPTSPASGYPCGTIGVTVTSPSSCGAHTSALTLDETSVTIERGQTASITASNCQGLAALSSDTDVVRTAVTGNQVSLYATTVGEVTVHVCDASGTCLPLPVSVVANK